MLPDEAYNAEPGYATGATTVAAAAGAVVPNSQIPAENLQPIVVVEPSHEDVCLVCADDNILTQGQCTHKVCIDCYTQLGLSYELVNGTCAAPCAGKDCLVYM